MPADVVSGQDLDDVAAYVGLYAGVPGAAPPKIGPRPGSWPPGVATGRGLGQVDPWPRPSGDLRITAKPSSSLLLGMADLAVSPAAYERCLERSYLRRRALTMAVSLGESFPRQLAKAIGVDCWRLAALLHGDGKDYAEHARSHTNQRSDYS